LLPGLGGVCAPPSREMMSNVIPVASIVIKSFRTPGFIDISSSDCLNLQHTLPRRGLRADSCAAENYETVQLDASLLRRNAEF
jgi:hypothetical protein